MFGDSERARQAFRLSPGRFTTERDIDVSAQLLIEVASQLQQVAA
jgi:cysteine desulfurase